MRNLSVFTILLVTIFWCGVFWLYHNYAINHHLSQTQIWYYHGEFVPLYALIDNNWRSYLPVWRWSVPPLIIAVLWISLVAARLKYLTIPDSAWLPACFVFALCMNLAVARVSGGYSALLAPFARYDMEYSGQIDKFDNPVELIENYQGFVSDRILGHHADIHPPGAVLFLWLAERIFGQGLFQMCAAAIVVSAIAVVPVYLLASELYGQTVATISAGIFLLTPNIVLFGATCMDGVFAILPIVAVWLFFRAISGRRSSLRTSVYAILMGLALASGLFLTYATVCIGAFTAIYNLLALSQGRRVFLRVLMVNLIAVGTMTLIYGIAEWRGWFDIVDCVRAAVAENQLLMGTGRQTLGIWIDVSTANLAAFLIDVGVVVTALWSWQLFRSIGELRRGEPDIFVFSSALAIVTISFSTLFYFEVERIWLFMVPFITIPAALALCRGKVGVRRSTFMFALLALFAQTYLTQLVLYTYW